MKQIDFFYAAILVKQKIESKIMLTEENTCKIILGDNVGHVDLFSWKYENSNRKLNWFFFLFPSLHSA